MKKMILLFFVAALGFSSCVKANKNDSAISDIPTVQFFTEEKVGDADLKKILLAGVNSQSGMNGQPWHFSAVTDKKFLLDLRSALREKMPADLPPEILLKADVASAPVAIFVSAAEHKEFDAALAVQIMAAQAVLLGYGTKIIASPNMILNGENQSGYKKILGVPDGMNFSAVLLVGKEDKKTDATSYATPRKSFAEVVTIVE